MARRNPASLDTPALGGKAASKTATKRHTKAPAQVETGEAVRAPEPASDLSNLAQAVGQSSVLSNDQIALLAYSYWEQRGHSGGSSDEDWLRAEQELRSYSR